MLMVVRWLIQAKVYENYSLEREIKASRVKVIEFKGYNSKIVSAGQDLERRSANSTSFIQASSYSRYGSDTTL